MCSSLSRYYFPYCYFPRNSWILFRLAPNLLYFESSFVRHLLLRGCCEFGFDSTRNNPVWFASNKVASGGFVSVGKVETMPYFDLWHGWHNRRLFLTDSFPLRIFYALIRIIDLLVNQFITGFFQPEIDEYVVIIFSYFVLFVYWISLICLSVGHLRFKVGLNLNTSRIGLICFNF